MASSRRTGTSEGISTYDSAGGKSYTAVSTWWTAHSADMASNISPVLEIYNGPHDDYIQLSGGAPTASYFPIVRPAAGHGHDGTRNVGALFASTTDTTLLLGIAYSSFQDLLVSPSLNSVNTRRIIDLGGANADAVGMIIYNPTNAGGGSFRPFYSAVAGEVKWINCRAEDVSVVSTAQFWCASASGTAHKFYNCSIVDGSGIGFFTTTSSQAIAVNCLADGMAGVGFSGTFATGTKNNASSKADAPGTNSQNSVSVTYASPSGNDYHIANIDTAVYGLGFDQSAEYDDDADNDGAISVWHIGADSIALVTPIVIVPTNDYSMFDGETLPLTDVVTFEGSANLATVRLQCSAGLALDVSNLSGCTVSAGARESTDMTLSGTTAQLQAASALLTCAASSNGTKTITVTVTDTSSQVVSDTFDVVVGATTLTITGSQAAVMNQAAIIYGSLNTGAVSGTLTYTALDAGALSDVESITLTLGGSSVAKKDFTKYNSAIRTGRRER